MEALLREIIDTTRKGFFRKTGFLLESSIPP